MYICLQTNMRICSVAILNLSPVALALCTMCMYQQRFTAVISPIPGTLPDSSDTPWSVKHQPQSLVSHMCIVYEVAHALQSNLHEVRLVKNVI